jgi:hypothetical protein
MANDASISTEGIDELARVFERLIVDAGWHFEDRMRARAQLQAVATELAYAKDAARKGDDARHTLNGMAMDKQPGEPREQQLTGCPECGVPNASCRCALSPYDRLAEPAAELVDECPNCGCHEVGTFTADNWFLYGRQQHRLCAEGVEFFRCMSCELEFTGEDGERKRAEAVRQFLTSRQPETKPGSATSSADLYQRTGSPKCECGHRKAAHDHAGCCGVCACVVWREQPANGDAK